MGPGELSVLFLGKADDGHVARAIDFCRRNFPGVGVYLGRWDEPLPDAAAAWTGDLIVSYLARWIVPAPLLARAALAINFHPGSPEYPGYGCNNFAIYEGATQYGVTCHHMAPRVDTGAIVAVKRFPVLPADDAGTLLVRAYDYQLVLFYEIAGLIARGEALPRAQENWTRKPFTRRQFGELGCVTPDMTGEEIAKRRRATDVSALRRAG